MANYEKSDKIALGKFEVHYTTRICVCETLCPSHMLFHKDGALFKDKGNIKFEAPSYTKYNHSLSAYQV